MLIKINRYIYLLLTILLVSQNLFSQGQTYLGPDDPAGDDAATRDWRMSGNRIYLYFQNTTELSKWVAGVGDPLWSKWPNDFNGVRMLDGVGLLIGAKVYVVDGDTIPVTDPQEIANGFTSDGKAIKTLYYLQTSYREEMDAAPGGFPNWGLYPVFGYFNEAGESPAMSDNSLSWPASWPGKDMEWDGEWNGRFGRGVQYADLETYFVANDAQDQEYLGPEDLTKYYPRPGVHIGDQRLNTIQDGAPWGGIGIRVSQRGFQWNNPQARDAIFWEYSIANISDYDLTEVAFGYWVDNGIGGEADDEIGYFDRDIDMAYSWDNDGIGRGGLPTGTMGFAYLESPGLAFDGEDNDNDGLTDERRNNDAGALVGPMDGITDLNRFLEFYHLTMEDLHDHYEGDEDQDWQFGTDLNNNGIYAINVGTIDQPMWVLEDGEDAGDDVGLDGVGPTEINYNGPDEGEGNGRPDFDTKKGCEPNFNLTDVSESDMVGLTSFQLFPVPSHASSFHWFRGDESMWEVIGADTLVEYLGNISNLIETFASGPFPLYQGEEERISMSELHSYDPLEGLKSNYAAPALFRQKEIVQIIYEKDYRFAQPPKMPTLKATAGDGYVILTWDNTADTKTREPLLNNKNDFEGYKLFRATDKFMSDARVITDGYGDTKYLKPIFQCDLKDNIEFFSDFGMIDGTGYYLGDETGIVHHYIDNNVQNGRVYYYAIVAYDYGIPDDDIAPSENNIDIKLDDKDNILSLGQNVQLVVPCQNAAGYVPPSLEQGDTLNLLGSGIVKPEIIAKNSLKADHTYKVKFLIDTISTVDGVEHAVMYSTKGIEIYDVTAGSAAPVYRENPQSFTYNNIRQVKEFSSLLNDSLVYYSFKSPGLVSTDVFHGLRISLELESTRPEYNYQNSGWKKGDGIMTVIPAQQDISYYPWNFEIVFTNNDSAYIGRLYNKNIFDQDNNSVNRQDLLFRLPYNFYIRNTAFLNEHGEYPKLDLVAHDQNNNDTFDLFEDRILAGLLKPDGSWAGTMFAIDFKGASESSLPQADDVYSMTYTRPFWSTDSILFTVKPEGELDKAELKLTMDDIKVVPNPYVATNKMEEAVRSSVLNQPRKLAFIHIPARCTISIFTSSGLLVDKIEVNNSSSNGIIHWDLLTSEGLEVAAGIYIYHLKSAETGAEKLGKFAIIK